MELLGGLGTFATEVAKSSFYGIVNSYQKVYGEKESQDPDELPEAPVAAPPDTVLVVMFLGVFIFSVGVLVVTSCGILLVFRKSVAKMLVKFGGGNQLVSWTSLATTASTGRVGKTNTDSTVVIHYLEQHEVFALNGLNLKLVTTVFNLDDSLPIFIRDDRNVNIDVNSLGELTPGEHYYLVRRSINNEAALALPAPNEENPTVVIHHNQERKTFLLSGLNLNLITSAFQLANRVPAFITDDQNIIIDVNNLGELKAGKHYYLAARQGDNNGGNPGRNESHDATVIIHCNDQHRTFALAGLSLVLITKAFSLNDNVPDFIMDSDNTILDVNRLGELRPGQHYYLGFNSKR